MRRPMTLEERYRLHILPDFVYAAFREAYNRYKKRQEEKKNECKAGIEGSK